MYPLPVVESSTGCLVLACLGKTPLCDETNIKDLVNGLTSRHENVIFLISDGLHKFEQMLTKHTSMMYAERCANAAGDRMKEILVRALSDWKTKNPESTATIEIERWASIKDDTYKIMYDTVTSFRPRFEDQFRASSQYYILHRRLNATITDAQLENYSQYLLEELPLLLLGAVIKGTRYTVIYYPVFPQARSDATAPDIGYISPIEDLAKSYREDPDFLAAGPQHLDITYRSSFSRVFFSNSDSIGSTGMSAKTEGAVLASMEGGAQQITIAN